MDIPLVLEKLRPGEDWGPCADSSSTYEQLQTSWRSPTPCPTRDEMLAAWDTIQVERAGKQADWQTAKQILQSVPDSWKSSPDTMKQFAWAAKYVLKLVKQGL